MSTYPGWPDYAKAVIQHEFDTDHLNLWLTYPERMLRSSNPGAEPPPIDVYPPIDLWLPELDGVPHTVDAQSWQDAYTLLLTIEAIGSLPARVAIVYDGPDPGLSTVTGKQWEPWGPILSLDITT